MGSKCIFITANGESISINNPEGLECAIVSFQLLSRLGSNLATHNDCIEALKLTVHADPSATVRISDGANNLIAKFLELSSDACK